MFLHVSAPKCDNLNVIMFGTYFLSLSMRGCFISLLGIRAVHYLVCHAATTKAGMSEAAAFEDAPAVVPVTAALRTGILGALALVSISKGGAESGRMGR